MELSNLSSSREDIIALYRKTPKDLQYDIGILKEWMKKQPHLPINSLQDEFLEIILLKNKFSIEKTKNKIESYCTLKGMKRYQYLYEANLCVPSKEPQFYIPLPYLTDDFRRIIVSKIWNQEKWDMKRDFSNVMVLREILAHFDYNDGEIVLYDITECTPMMISKFRPNIMSDLVVLALKAHSARIKEIHLVSKLASVVFGWTRPFLPSKIASRVFIHDSFDAILNFLPSKCLPKDYGGELKSLDELRNDFDRIYTMHREDLLRYLNIKSREELRLGGPVMDEMQGTFKQLDID